MVKCYCLWLDIVDKQYFLLAVKGLCIEKSSKTEPVDFEPLVDKGTHNNLVINLLYICTLYSRDHYHK